MACPIATRAFKSKESRVLAFVVVGAARDSFSAAAKTVRGASHFEFSVVCRTTRISRLREKSIHVKNVTTATRLNAMVTWPAGSDYMPRISTNAGKLDAIVTHEFDFPPSDQFKFITIGATLLCR